MKDQLNLDSSVVAELHRLAELLYPGLHYGPSVDQWNMYRQSDHVKAESIMQRYMGRNARSRSRDWPRILAAAGLENAPRSEMQGATKRMAERDNNRISSWQPRLSRCNEPYYRSGLPVRERELPINQWCVKRHDFVTVGIREVYEII